MTFLEGPFPHLTGDATYGDVRRNPGNPERSKLRNIRRSRPSVSFGMSQRLSISEP